nr:MAK10-like protein [Tanacetum cinerariifolium]
MWYLFDLTPSAGGKLRDRNTKESWALLKDFALYDNESWNDPRNFAKPVKEISLPQDVPSTSDHCLIELENQVQRLMEAHLALMKPTQVNKITFLCEICSGPHDTQYCMENPKQAFVEYASSHTDEATGSNRDDEGIEWLDVKEPLDLVDINGTKDITVKTPYKDKKRSELSNEGHNLLSSRIILSEDDYDIGCRKPSDLEDGFYKDTIKLGSEYLTGMDDQGEVT